MEDLYKLLHKAKILREPPTEEEQRLQALKDLRKYFNTFSRRKKKRPSQNLQLTLFTWPVPYLSSYVNGDEKLTELKPEIYTSVRKARRRLLNELALYRTKCAQKRTRSQWI